MYDQATLHVVEMLEGVIEGEFGEHHMWSDMSTKFRQLNQQVPCH
jgi:hypothetical protein